MSTSTRAARCSVGQLAAAPAGRRSRCRVASAWPPGCRSRERSVSGSGTVGRAWRRRTPVEAGVDHDPVQPGGHRGVAPEPVGRPVGRQQRVLQRVGRLLAVAERAQGDRPEPVAVPADQLGERVRVAGDVGAQQRRVVARVAPRRSRLAPYRAARPRRAHWTKTVISSMPTRYSLVAVRRQLGDPHEQVAGLLVGRREHHVACRGRPCRDRRPACRSMTIWVSPGRVVPGSWCRRAAPPWRPGVDSRPARS